MTPSAVPAMIAWPFIAFMTVVLLGRYRWFNENLSEKYINNTLAFLWAAQLLREPFVQRQMIDSALVTEPGVWQISTALMGYSFTEFIGFSMLWSGMPEAETRRKHRYYRMAAILLITGFLICGTRARLANKPLELLVGWDSVTTLSCLTAMLMVLAIRLVWNSLSELRAANSPRERWIALSTLLMGVFGVGIVVQEAALQLLDQLGWTHTASYRKGSHEDGLFFGILAPFVMAAVPLALKLLRSLGLDRTTRSWHKLQPLRQAMRAVTPERFIDSDDEEFGRRGKSTLQLHDTVVEIRDAILRLRPYVRAIPEDEVICFLDVSQTVRASEREAALAALRLAHAANAKTAGITPDPPEGDAALIVTLKATTLEEEAAELLTLAKWWPSAYAAATSVAPTKASPTP